MSIRAAWYRNARPVRAVRQPAPGSGNASLLETDTRTGARTTGATDVDTKRVMAGLGLAGAAVAGRFVTGHVAAGAERSRSTEDWEEHPDGGAARTLATIGAIGGVAVAALSATRVPATWLAAAGGASLLASGGGIALAAWLPHRMKEQAKLEAIGSSPLGTGRFLVTWYDKDDNSVLDERDLSGRYSFCDDRPCPEVTPASARQIRSMMRATGSEQVRPEDVERWITEHDVPLREGRVDEASRRRTKDTAKLDAWLAWEED